MPRISSHRRSAVRPRCGTSMGGWQFPLNVQICGTEVCVYPVRAHRFCESSAHFSAGAIGFARSSGVVLTPSAHRDRPRWVLPLGQYLAHHPYVASPPQSPLS
jgi:hypothetical protein